MKLVKIIIINNVTCYNHEILYYSVHRRAGERVGNIAARRVVVHFTFHILRRTAAGRRNGNVAEGPHSFRIKRHRRHRRRRGRCRRSLVGRMREPRSAHRTRCAQGEIFPPSRRGRHPPVTLHRSSSITRPPSGGIGASWRTGSWRGGRGKQATRLLSSRYILYTMLFKRARGYEGGRYYARGIFESFFYLRCIYSGVALY